MRAASKSLVQAAISCSMAPRTGDDLEQGQGNKELDCLLFGLNLEHSNFVDTIIRTVEKYGYRTS